MKENMKDGPSVRFQAGPVSCGVWETEIESFGQRKVLYKVSVGKRYQDRGGVWKTGTSFTQTEIPLAIYCLQQAFDWMIRDKSRQVEEVITTDD
jgi:hypothetical protein